MPTVYVHNDYDTATKQTIGLKEIDFDDADATKDTKIYTNADNTIAFEAGNVLVAQMTSNGLDMQGTQIKNIADATDNADAVNKSYVDTSINNVAGSITDLTLNSLSVNGITSLQKTSATDTQVNTLTTTGAVAIGNTVGNSALSIVGDRDIAPNYAGIHMGDDVGSNNYGIEICGNDTTNTGLIDFTIPNNDMRGRIIYNHGNKQFQITTLNTDNTHYDYWALLNGQMSVGDFSGKYGQIGSGASYTYFNRSTASSTSQAFVIDNNNNIGIGGWSGTWSDKLNIYGVLNMQANTILNVADPLNLQDAATKNYVDTQIANNASDIQYYSSQVNLPSNTFTTTINMPINKPGKYLVSAFIEYNDAAMTPNDSQNRIKVAFSTYDSQATPYTSKYTAPTQYEGAYTVGCYTPITLLSTETQQLSAVITLNATQSTNNYTPQYNFRVLMKAEIANGN